MEQNWYSISNLDAFCKMLIIQLLQIREYYGCLGCVAKKSMKKKKRCLSR